MLRDARTMYKSSRIFFLAYRLQDQTTFHFNELQDLHGGAWLLFCATTRWLAIRLDTIIALYITIISVMMVPLSLSESLTEMLHLTPASIGEEKYIHTNLRKSVSAS